MIVPAKDDPLETGDELLFVTSEDVEDELATLLSGSHHHDACSPGGRPPGAPAQSPAITGFR